MSIRMSRGEKGIFTAAVAIVLVQLVVYGGLLWAAVHFIRKWW